MCNVVGVMFYCPQNQIHGLWQAVEDKKEELAQLTKQVESEERRLALDKALDTQVKDSS